MHFSLHAALLLSVIANPETARFPKCGNRRAYTGHQCMPNSHAGPHNTEIVKHSVKQLTPKNGFTKIP